MKRIKLSLLALLLVCSTVLSLVSCQTPDNQTGLTETKEPAVTQTEQTQTQQQTTEEKIPTLPEYMNPLTGLACDPSLVGKRPAAIVFNNIKVSLPQSGISNCDIVYEVLAEGGILRLTGIVQDYANTGNLGSMRSARPYMVELSLAYDALFLHAGGSDKAYETIQRLGVNDVDGVKRGPFSVNGTSVFWRDQNRLNAGVSLEHTMFTSGTNFAAAVAAKKYRTTLNDPQFTAFSFDPAFKGIGSGKSATYVKVPHSNYSVSEFNYNAEDGLYYHNQYGNKHVDVQNGAHVSATNLFILFTEQSIYPNQVGTTYLQIGLVGEGKGYYMNGGEYTPIVWKRASETGTFSYYNVDGTELKVECGKSYVSIADEDIYSRITIS